MDNKALELQSVEVQTRAAAAVATKEQNVAMVSPSADGGYSWEGRWQPSITPANAKMEEKKQQRHREGLTESSWSRVGVPGLRRERRASPERLQQLAHFQKRQMEEKQVKWRLELFDTDGFQGTVLSQYVGLCTSAEEGSGAQARRGRTQPPASGLSSDSSADGEAAGQAEQAAEEPVGPHQPQTGPGTATVSSLFTPKQHWGFTSWFWICIVSRRPALERGCVEDSFYSQFNTCSRWWETLMTKHTGNQPDVSSSIHQLH